MKLPWSLLLNKSELLRGLPAVDELLRHTELTELRRSHGHDLFVEWIREAINQVRRELQNGRDVGTDQLFAAIIELVRARVNSEAQQVIRPVINATGTILHTNLGRAPLPALAIERMRSASAYTNLELDLDSGERGRRGARVMKLLARLSGTEEAMVVNNCAAATVLVLQALAFGKEVIISRGQLVEIGGGFRLPDVFNSAGVILRDIGTTNRTYCRDYENAIHEATGAIIRVHRSNFAQIGFVTEPSIAELAALWRPQSVPVIDDLGSGNLYDLSEFGLQEPRVATSIEAGADMVLFSGDKLFGGPQCGIIVGKKIWLEKLRSNPLMRALRADKVTLAALEATTEIHLSGNAFRQLPVLQMLSRAAEDVRSNCTSVVEQLSSAARRRVTVVDCQSQLGGGTLPGQVLPSFAIAIGGPHLQPLARALRLGTPAIQGRIKDDRLLLDLRTVPDAELKVLAERIDALLRDDPGGAS